MKVCKQCNKHKLLSSRGLCFECGLANQRLVTNQMKARQGNKYRKWQLGMIKYGNNLMVKLKQAKDLKEEEDMNQRQQQEQQQK